MGQASSALHLVSQGATTDPENFKKQLEVILSQGANINEVNEEGQVIIYFVFSILINSRVQCIFLPQRVIIFGGWDPRYIKSQ